MVVHDTALAQNVVISNIYAPAQLRHKEYFWEHLIELNNVIDSPWCLISDLNEIGAPNEKRGGITPADSKFKRLNHFLEAINAESVPVDGRLFTWRRRIHTNLIYERLDRAIARKDWLNIYPQAFELHGNFTCSDHCPIILSTTIEYDR